MSGARPSPQQPPCCNSHAATAMLKHPCARVCAALVAPALACARACLPSGDRVAVRRQRWATAVVCLLWRRVPTSVGPYLAPRNGPGCACALCVRERSATVSGMRRVCKVCVCVCVCVALALALAPSTISVGTCESVRECGWGRGEASGVREMREGARAV
jgi:hypothetical protein